MLTRKYEEDNDKYCVKQHMEKIGQSYMYGGYITPSHIYYPGNETYRKRIYNSYLMAKYLGTDEISLNEKMKNVFKEEADKVKVFHSMEVIKRKISEWDIFSKNGTSVFPVLTAMSKDTDSFAIAM